MGKGARGNQSPRASEAHLAVLATNGSAAMERTARSQAPKSAFGPGSVTPRAPTPARPRSAPAPPATPACRGSGPTSRTRAGGASTGLEPGRPRAGAHTRREHDQLRRRICVGRARARRAAQPPMHALRNADGVTPLHLACRGGRRLRRAAARDGREREPRDAFGWAPARLRGARQRVDPAHARRARRAAPPRDEGRLDAAALRHVQRLGARGAAAAAPRRQPRPPGGLGGLSAREMAKKFRQSTIASLFDAVDRAGSVDKFLAQLERDPREGRAVGVAGRRWQSAEQRAPPPGPGASWCRARPAPRNRDARGWTAEMWISCGRHRKAWA